MARYTIHKSANLTSSIGYKPMSETARIRRFGRLRGIGDMSLKERLLVIFRPRL